MAERMKQNKELSDQRAQFNSQNYQFFPSSSFALNFQVRFR